MFAKNIYRSWLTNAIFFICQNNFVVSLVHFFICSCSYAFVCPTAIHSSHFFLSLAKLNNKFRYVNRNRNTHVVSLLMIQSGSSFTTKKKIAQLMVPVPETNEKHKMVRCIDLVSFSFATKKRCSDIENKSELRERGKTNLFANRKWKGEKKSKNLYSKSIFSYTTDASACVFINCVLESFRISLALPSSLSFSLEFRSSSGILRKWKNLERVEWTRRNHMDERACYDSSTTVRCSIRRKTLF